MKKFNLETIKKAYVSGLSQRVINQLINSLPDYEGYHGSDLHGLIFNEDLLYIKILEAERDLNELGVFDCIALVKEYEQYNFGKFSTAINPCNIAHMVGYIIGEFINNSAHLTNNCWDSKLTENDIAIIEDELQTYLESLDEDLSNVAFDEWEI